MNTGIKLAWWLVIMTAGGYTARAAEDKAEKAKPYQLQVASEPATVAVGATAQYRLTITPQAPWVLKTTTPLKAKLKPSAGVSLAKTTLTAKEIVDPNSVAKTVATNFSATKSGAQRIAAEVSFFLCTEEICERNADTIDLAVTVP